MDTVEIVGFVALDCVSNQTFILENHFENQYFSRQKNTFNIQNIQGDIFLEWYHEEFQDPLPNKITTIVLNYFKN